jgi:hypothetical protein
MSSIRSITRIEPGQFALIIGATYALMGIIAAILMFMFASMIPIPGMGNMGRGVAVILVPVIYGVLGYVSGFIGAAVYNLVAGTVGGIKVTVSE